jgi:teichoic acid transport system permease protein
LLERGRGPVPAGYIEIGVAPPIGIYLKRLWRRRDFIVHVPLGQLRAQTHSTMLGGLWHLLNPLLHAALYYLIFGIIFNANRTVSNYPAFLTTGIFTFLYTNRSINSGARSITNNLSLIAQLGFPRAALPISATVAEFVSHLMAIVALLVTLVLLGVAPTFTWLLLLPIVGAQTIFNLGLALVVGRLAFHFRDIQELLPHALRFWMYLSGLFFTLDFITDRVGPDSPVTAVFRANPGYAFMTLMRGALLDGHAADPTAWPVVIAWSLAALIGGFVFFRAREVEYSGG